MNAGHQYCMHWYHHYTDTISSLDMVCYYTLITVITYHITEMLYGLLLHIYVPLVHGYTNARTTAFHIIVIIVTWMLDTQLSHVHTSLLYMLTARVYMHVLFLSSCHMNHRAYYMYYCSMLALYSSYMIISCY